jgi:hypothetical protein
LRRGALTLFFISIIIILPPRDSSRWSASPLAASPAYRKAGTF